MKEFGENHILFFLNCNQYLQKQMTCAIVLSICFQRMRRMKKRSKQTLLCPIEGTCKINIDSSLGENRQIGLGFVGQDYRGKVIFTGLRRIPSPFYVEIAELLPLLYGVEIAIQEGFRHNISQRGFLNNLQQVKKPIMWTPLKQKCQLRVFISAIQITRREVLSFWSSRLQDRSMRRQPRTRETETETKI